MLSGIKKNIKGLLPDGLKFFFKLSYIRLYHQIELFKVRRKEKLKVVFIVIHDSVWKYEKLYWLMDKHPRFEPIVIVCPYIAFNEEGMKSDLKRTFLNFKKRGINVISSFINNKWLDVRAELNPDLIFFTNPWDGLTMRQYNIHNFIDKLTCYVPYGFKNSYLYQSHFNKPMQNYVWKFFLETKVHQKLSKQISKNKGSNTVVLGYPGGDDLLEGKIDFYPWKSNSESIKKVIWAPHHTIPGMGATLDYSTFLDYCDFMLELAIQYKDKIEFSFKPHPILRHKLSKDDVWGEKKTNEYYSSWANGRNTSLAESDYKDLFLSSDALIHDSSSFVVEYLYVNKPVLFLYKEKEVFDRFNEFGKMAIKKSYTADSKQKIKFFLDNVVLDSKDEMFEERVNFFDKFLKPPFNKSASENIFNFLIKVLDKK